MVDMHAHILLGSDFPNLLLFKYIDFETASSHFEEDEVQIEINSETNVEI